MQHLIEWFIKPGQWNDAALIVGMLATVGVLYLIFSKAE